MYCQVLIPSPTVFELSDSSSTGQMLSLGRLQALGFLGGLRILFRTRLVAVIWRSRPRWTVGRSSSDVGACGDGAPDAKFGDLE